MQLGLDFWRFLFFAMVLSSFNLSLIAQFLISPADSSVGFVFWIVDCRSFCYLLFSFVLSLACWLIDIFFGLLSCNFLTAVSVPIHLFKQGPVRIWLLLKKDILLIYWPFLNFCLFDHFDFSLIILTKGVLQTALEVSFSFLNSFSMQTLNIFPFYLQMLSSLVNNF